MKKTKPKKLLTVLLALCMVLSIVPITAFAVEIDFLPQGVTYLNDYKHTYHTQVNVTANVSVKDSDGTVVETTQVSKSTEEFLKGGVGMLQSNIARLQTEIETPYQASGTVTRGDRGAQTIFDHFETASFYTFTPASGDPVKFSTDLDAAKQYFSEHPDATGTFTKLLDVHEYQKYNYTYDLTVQENSQPASTITSAVVKNVKFNYQPGDAPQATAEVYNDDADKYEIDYECWQQFENNEPVAAWYSDNGSHGSLPTITEFESGKKYVYFLMLKPKDGYSFNSETAVTVNGESVKSSLSGEYLYVPAVKTITPTKQNTVITSAAVENVKLDYKDGEAPHAPQPRQQLQTEINTIFSMNVGVSWKKPMSTQPNPWHTGIQTRTIVPQVMQILPPLIRMASMNIPYDWKPKTATSLVTAFQPMILPSTAKVCPKAHLL